MYEQFLFARFLNEPNAQKNVCFFMLLIWIKLIAKSEYSCTII